MNEKHIEWPPRDSLGRYKKQTWRASAQQAAGAPPAADAQVDGPPWVFVQSQTSAISMVIRWLIFMAVAWWCVTNCGDDAQTRALCGLAFGFVAIVWILIEGLLHVVGTPAPLPCPASAAPPAANTQVKGSATVSDETFNLLFFFSFLLWLIYAVAAYIINPHAFDPPPIKPEDADPQAIILMVIGVTWFGAMMVVASHRAHKADAKKGDPASAALVEE